MTMTKDEVHARIAKMIPGGLLLKFTSYDHIVELMTVTQVMARRCSASRSCYHKLAHHTGILVLKDVTMIHVWMLRVGKVREFDDNTHGRARINEHSILEAMLMRQRRFSIAIKRSKLDAVNMKWMSQWGCVLDRPDFNAAPRNSLVNAAPVH